MFCPTWTEGEGWQHLRSSPRDDVLTGAGLNSASPTEVIQIHKKTIHKHWGQLAQSSEYLSQQPFIVSKTKQMHKKKLVEMSSVFFFFFFLVPDPDWSITWESTSWHRQTPYHRCFWQCNSRNYCVVVPRTVPRHSLIYFLDIVFIFSSVRWALTSSIEGELLN